MWWACTRPGARVITQAPTGRQVRGVWYRETRKMHREAKAPIGGVVFELPDRGIQWPDDREIIGFSTSEAERLAGFSGENSLYIVDEASGVEDEIFETIDGNLAAGGRLIIVSNPTRTSGVFYDAFNRHRNLWHCIHLSSTESPNVTGETWISGLAGKDWIERMRTKWGEHSAWYQVHVEGNFPQQAENCVISLGIVSDAIERWRNWKSEGSQMPADRLAIGVDPARFGDDESAVFCCRGRIAFGHAVFRNLQLTELAERVKHIARREMRHGERPIVRVDVVGLGGGVADILRKEAWMEVVDVQASEAARDPQFERKRDEGWFALRDWLRDGGCIPEDLDLQAELVAPTYSFNVGGRIKVESKDDLRKRIKKSPDRADALTLAVWHPGGAVASFRDVEWKGPGWKFGNDREADDDAWDHESEGWSVKVL